MMRRTFKMGTIAVTLFALSGIAEAGGHAEIAPGNGTTLLRKADGTLWSWGMGLYMGIGTSDMSTKTATQIPGTWTHTYNTEGTSYAMKQNGATWAWGANVGERGQLGLGPLLDFALRPTRVNLPPIGRVVTSRFGASTLAFAHDGSVYRWGPISAGGPGWLTTPTSAPDLTAILGGAKVSAGADHFVARLADGTLWSWGGNTYGQLGVGPWPDPAVAADTPLQLPDNDWANVVAGYWYTLAQKSDGSLWSWGSNMYGELGTGDLVFQDHPVRVGSDTDWVAISTGRNHVMALKANGTLWGWGRNDMGQLGTGNNVDQLAPIQLGSDNDWFNVVAGRHNVMGIKLDGSLWGWGNNNTGDLGLTLAPGVPDLSYGHNLPSQIDAANHISLLRLPDRKDFGAVRQGAAAAQSFALTNPDPVRPFTITRISAPARYSLNHDCPASLPPSSSCTILATLNTSLRGVYKGEITILTPSATVGEVVIPVSASVRAHQISAPTSHNFGVVNLGQGSTQPLTITNYGNFPLTISSITSGAAMFSVNRGNCAVVVANGTCTFSVTYAPTAPGLRNAVVTINSDDPVTPAKKVAVSGTGQGPRLTRSRGFAVFGATTVGQTASTTITLSNAGNMPLDIAGISTSGAAEFGIDASGCPASLSAGASCNVTATFTPTVAGKRVGRISVSSSDPFQPLLAIALSGTGQ